MNLEAYRKKVQRRLVWVRAMAVVFIVVELVVSRFAPESALSNFVWGACIGGGVTALVVMIRQRKALEDEARLRRMYIAEHDERMQAIRTRAGQPMVLFLSLGLVMAATVAHIFSETVCLTLLLVAAAQLAVSLIVKLICMKRM